MRVRTILAIGRHDLLDLRRQRGVWMGLVLIPFVTVSFLLLLPGVLAEREAKSQARAVYRVAVEATGDADAVGALREGLPASRFRVEATDDARALVSSSKADVGLVLATSDVAAALAGEEEQVTGEVLVLAGRSRSRAALGALGPALDEFAIDITERRLEARQLPLSTVHPFAVETIDLSETPRGQRLNLATLLPLLVLLPVAGTVGVAAQRISGSKDQRVFEPLLVLPFTRRELLLGKALGALAIGSVTLVAVGVPLFLGRFVPMGAGGRSISLPLRELIAVLGIGAVMLVLLVVLGVAVGAASRTSAELGSVLQMATLPIFLLGSFLQFRSGIVTTPQLLVLPFFGPLLCLRDVALGTLTFGHAALGGRVDPRLGRGVHHRGGAAARERTVGAALVLVAPGRLYDCSLVKRTGGSLAALVALLVGLVIPAGPASGVDPGPTVLPVPPHAEADPSTALVRFADHVGPAARSAALSRHGLGHGARAIGPSTVVEVAAGGRTRAELARELRDEPGVVSIAPNLIRRAFAEPNDPLYVQQREYLDVLRIEAAWDEVPDPVVPLNGPVIAVIDSGVNAAHPDLAGRVLPGRDFTGSLAVDNADDEAGHGTKVAGVAAASTNNLEGIAGAAWNAQILPVRVLDEHGSGTDADVAEGIYYAVEQGADVINLSLGGYGADVATRDAVAHALEQDIVVVAAAGNLVEGATLFKEPVYPAAYPGVVGVSATEDSGRSVRFSLFGSWVDVAAPGYAIVATTKEGGYDYPSGTSFAAPLVAGVVAILRAADPALSQTDIVQKLSSTARDTGLPGRDDVYGWGILDAAALVAGADEQAAIPPTPGDAYEPNDSIGSAAVVTTAPVSATIAPEGEIDHYRFTVPAGSVVTVDVQAPPTVGVAYALDPMLRVRTSAGTLLSSRDANADGEPETITFETSAGGTFTAEVENFLPTLGSGPYTFKVSTAPLAPPTTATTTTTTTTSTTPTPPTSTTTTTTTTTSPPPTSTTTAPPAPTPPPKPPARSGYWMVGRDGAVYGFGDAHNHGRVVGMTGGIEAVDLEPTPSLGGYWIATNSGHVHAFGDAPTLGGIDGALVFGESVTSISRTASGRGYWLFTTKGRVVAFGDAPHLGDMSGTRLNGPVLDSIPSPSGNGYYMVASDGGIFTFGDAVFQGSMGGIPLNAPVQSLVPDADGSGYWLVASDGGIFSFDAPFRGSMGDTRLNGPITGMVRFGNGYLMVGTDGGIFTFTDKEFYGSLGANPPASPVVSVAAAEG